MKTTHIHLFIGLFISLCFCYACQHQQSDLSRAYALFEEAEAANQHHEVAEAIQLLHQCQLILEGYPAERDFRRMVLSLLGDAYFEQKNYAESLPVYQEFLSLCETDREKSIACHDLSSYFVMTEQPDSALFYAHRSLSHALADGDSLKTAYRLHSLALAHNVFQQPDSALLYARQALAYVPSAEPKGTYYYAIGTLLYDADAPADSVSLYMAQAAADTTYEGRFNTYYILSELAEEQGDYPAALDYLYRYTDHLDSLYVAERGVDVQQLVYEYQTQLQVSQERKRGERLLWMVGTAFILAVSVLMVLWLYNKRHKEQLSMRMVALRRLQEEEYMQSEAHIADNMRQIASLKSQIEDLGTENKQLRQQLERQIEKMEAENKLTQLIIDDREARQAEVKSSAIYTELMALADSGKTLRPEHEGPIEALLDAIYPDFRKNLSVNQAESPFEYQLCLLTKLGVRSSIIAVLTSHTPSGISRAKERLYAKLNGNVGKAADFDRYIANLS